jgi:hypothetical protein
MNLKNSMGSSRTRQALVSALALAMASGLAFAAEPPATTPPASTPPAPAPAAPGVDTGRPVDPSRVKELTRDTLRTDLPGKAEPAKPAGAPFQPPPGTIAAPAPGQPLPQGKGIITFSETVHDFGKVYDTTPRKWSAKFKNTGTEKLVISQVRPGCGCTAASLAKYDYEPGEEGTIELTWNPTGMGEVTKPVTITSNDMNEPNKVINIKATMVPLVKLDPMFLQGGTIQAGNERPMRLVVQSRDKDFTIKSVEFENNQTMAWKEVPDESKTVDETYPGRKAVEFMVPKDAPVGSFMRSANIIVLAKLDGATEPTESRYNIRAFANIVGDLMATPAYITVAGAKPQTAFESTVTVTSRSGKPFEIKSAEVIDVAPPSVGGLTAKAEALPENKGWKITLSGNPGSYVGAFRGSVRLATSLDAEGPTIVPFSGMSMQTLPTAPTATTPAVANPAPAPAPASPAGTPAPKN